MSIIASNLATHHVSVLFFFYVTATPEIYTLSLHDALPIFEARLERPAAVDRLTVAGERHEIDEAGAFGAADLACDIEADRKSTRLNSSHTVISYAVFCLKKKNKKCEVEKNC